MKNWELIIFEDDDNDDEVDDMVEKGQEEGKLGVNGATGFFRPLLLQFYSSAQYYCQ